MPVTRLNHVVLYVRHVPTTRAFYQEVLGFTEVFNVADKGSFLQAPGSTNDHDIGLFEIGSGAGPSEAGRRTVGMYHIAWEVSTLNDLLGIRDELTRRGHLVGATDHTTTKALYGVDPDGLEFEVSWLVPASLITAEMLESRKGNKPLHLEAEIARFGSDTLGGLGVSIPLGVSAQ
jgi:catechol-2,3-dioxygenase